MQQVFLKMVPDGVNPVIYATQNDDGRVFRFKLLNSDESDAYVLNGTETITAKIVKPDNTEITIAITNPGIGKDYCDMVIGSDDCDLAGVYIGEASLLDYGRPLGSINFILKVEPDAYDGANVVVMDCGPADICTFETNLADTLVSLIANITASGGNGTTSTPIPIVGHSELNLVRCGKNLLPPYTLSSGGGITITSNNGTYIISGTTTAYYQIIADTSFILKAGTYTLKNNGNVDNNLAVQLRSTNGLTIYANSSINSDTFTINEDTEVKFRMTFNNVGSYSATISPQLELGSTATAYEPYNRDTFTVAFGQTVYGGVYDANAGKVRITWGEFDLGLFNFSMSTAGTYNRFYSYSTQGIIKPSESSSVIPNALCTQYSVASFEDCQQANTNYIFGITNEQSVAAGYISFVNNDYSDAAAFRTAMAGVKVVCELLTPIEIDVSELSVDTIVGVNNVFCDTGETELKYLKIEG